MEDPALDKDKFNAIETGIILLIDQVAAVIFVKKSKISDLFKNLKDFFINSLNLATNLNCRMLQHNGSCHLIRDLFSKHTNLFSWPLSIRLYLFL